MRGDGDTGIAGARRGLRKQSLFANMGRARPEMVVYYRLDAIDGGLRKIDGGGGAAAGSYMYRWQPGGRRRYPASIVRIQ